MFKKDKLLHFAAGFVIAVILGLLFRNEGIGLMLSIFAGVVKEVADWSSRQKWWKYEYHGTPDILDFLITAFGAFAGTTLIGLLLEMIA